MTGSSGFNVSPISFLSRVPILHFEYLHVFYHLFLGTQVLLLFSLSVGEEVCLGVERDMQASGWVVTLCKIWS